MKRFGEYSVYVFSLTLFLSMPGVRAEGAKLAPGKIKLVGRYSKKKLAEGPRRKTYFELPAGGRMRLRAGGPTSFVLLVRGDSRKSVKLELDLDGEQAGQTELDLLAGVSRGVYIKVPAGTHLVKITTSARVFLRPRKVKRGPAMGESTLAWRPRKEDASLELVPLAPPVEKTPPPVADTPPALAKKTPAAADIPPPIVNKPPPAVDSPSPVAKIARAPQPSGAPKAEPVPKPVKPSALNIKNRPVEVRLRILADRLAAGLGKLPGAGRYERLVVAHLAESGADTKDMELGTLISAQLATFFKRDHGFILIERDRLVDVLKEFELSMSGVLDPSKAARIGKMAGAQVMIVGNVSQAGADFVINARAISVETAGVLAAESINVPRAGMVALSEDSVILRSRSGAFFRSLLIPGWGQFYNRQPIKGGVLIGVEAGLAAAAVALHFLGAADENSYRSADFAQKYAELTPTELGQKATALRDSAENFYQWRNVMIYSAIGVWLYNILDAYLFGVDGEQAAGLEIMPLGPAAAAGRPAAGLGMGLSF